MPQLVNAHVKIQLQPWHNFTHHYSPTHILLFSDIQPFLFLWKYGQTSVGSSIWVWIMSFIYSLKLGIIRIQQLPTAKSMAGLSWSDLSQVVIGVAAGNHSQPAVVSDRTLLSPDINKIWIPLDLSWQSTQHLTLYFMGRQMSQTFFRGHIHTYV